jgi:hypothetical protein
MRWAAISLLLPGFLLAADCSCPPATTQEQFDLATSVFRGKIVEIRESKNEPTEFFFEIQDVFKGELEDDITLQDAEYGQPCVMDFQGGKAYLVYARWTWGRDVTSRCMGTKPIETAESDRAVIGPGNAWKSKVYPKLREMCMGRYDTTCCLASIKAMEKGSYLPEPQEGGCPVGSKPNVVRCKGGIRWCEPL